VVVGICQLTFHLPGNRSLKGKRQIIRRMTERIRNRFHISIGEVDDLDRHQRACLGLAVVGNSTRKLQSVLDQILQSIDQMQLAPLIEKQIEFIQYEREFGMDRPLLDPEAVKHGGWDDEFGEFDDHDDHDDDSARGADDSSDEADAPDAPWASKPKGADNPWAFLDEWDD